MEGFDPVAARAHFGGNRTGGANEIRELDLPREGEKLGKDTPANVNAGVPWRDGLKCSIQGGRE